MNEIFLSVSRQICSKGFPSKPQLRKHLKKHMDREPNTPVTQLTVSEQEVDSDEELITPVTQVTVCKEEVDIDEPNTHVTQLTVFKQEVDSDEEPTTAVTQLTLCTQERIEQGWIKMFDIKPSKVVLRRSECNFTL